MSRVIPKSHAKFFMKALAKRARRRVKNGWKPACEHVIANVLCGGILPSPNNLPLGPIACGKPATHVDHNMKPLCAAHIKGLLYAERF